MSLDGPRLAPASGGPAKSLVILLHGYGSNGEDLIGLAPYWQRLLPDTAFASPNAPQECPGAPMGYQWFPITRLDPDEAYKGVSAAMPILNAFIDAELEKNELDESQLVLVGFSQGTMMSLHTGLRRDKQLAGILGFSGALAGPQHLEAEIKSRPPVLLIHGDQDPMIPVQAMFTAVDELGKVDTPVQWHVSPGVPHSISADGLELGGKFVATHLANA